MSGFKVKALSRHPLSSEILELCLEKPFDFLAGQYLFVHFENSLYPFSIASSPQDSSLCLHIQNSPAHPLPPSLWAHLNTHAQFHISAPEGQAYLRPHSKRPLLFVAGGSGFAPIHSMIQILTQEKSQRTIQLYWGVREPSLLYHLDHIADWQKTLAHFSYTPIISNRAPQWQGRRGWVHEAVLADHPHLSSFDIYIAGPFALTEAAVRDWTPTQTAALQIYSDALPL